MPNNFFLTSGSGFVLWTPLTPPTQTFADTTERDTYFSANPDELARLDANEFLVVRVGTTAVTYYNRQSSTWVEITSLVQGQQGTQGAPGISGNSYFFTSISDRDTFFGTPPNQDLLENGLPVIVNIGNNTTSQYIWSGVTAPPTYDPNLWRLSATEVSSGTLYLGEAGANISSGSEALNFNSATENNYLVNYTRYTDAGSETQYFWELASITSIPLATVFDSILPEPNVIAYTATLNVLFTEYIMVPATSGTVRVEGWIGTDESGAKIVDYDIEILPGDVGNQTIFAVPNPSFVEVGTDIYTKFTGIDLYGGLQTTGPFTGQTVAFVTLRVLQATKNEFPSSLAEVLAVGNTTEGNNIFISDGDSIVSSGSNTPILDINNSATSGNVIEFVSSNQTGTILEMIGSGLTTGKLANFYSNSASNQTRNLVEINNDNALATGTRCLTIIQDAPNYGILVQQNENNRAIEIECTGITSSYGLSVSTANNLTTGGLARFYSNGTDGSTRNLVEIVNDNVLATGTTCLYIKQDSTENALEVIGITRIETNNLAGAQTSLNVVSNDPTANSVVAGFLTSGTVGNNVIVSSMIQSSSTATSTTTLLCINDSVDASSYAINAIGNVNIDGKLTVSGLIDPTGLVLDEQSASPASPVAGFGTLWVKNDTPNILVFTDDTGTDHELSGAGVVDTLSEVLTAGNTTGGNNIVMSSGAVTGDRIIFKDGSSDDGEIYYHTSGDYMQITSTGALFLDALFVEIGSTFAGGYVTIESVSDSGTQLLLLDRAGTNPTFSRLYLDSIAPTVQGGDGDVWFRKNGVNTDLYVNKNGTWQGIFETISAQDTLAEVLVNGNVTGGTDIVITDGDSITGSGSSTIIELTPAITTSNAVDIQTSTKTTGKLLYVLSTSASSTGELVHIDNTAGSATCLKLEQDIPANYALDTLGRARVNTDGATIQNGFEVIDSTLTTGNLANFTSSSIDVSARNLVEIANTNSSATGAVGLYINQNADNYAFNVDGNGIQTSIAFNVEANSLTTGNVARIYSSSDDTSTRSMISVINDSSLASGTTCFDITQQSDAPAFDVNSDSTTANVFSLSNSNLTTGSLARMYSNSASTQSRTLLEITNDNILATGTKCLSIDQDGNNSALYIDSLGTTTNTAIDILANGISSGIGIDASFNSLTTGLGVRFSSSSADGSSRDLVQIVNSDLSSSGTIALAISQASSGSALYINSTATSGNVSQIVSNSNQTGTLFNVIGSSLTTGGLARFYSNSSSAETRNLLEITNDNDLADSATCLVINQDGDAPSISIDSNGDGTAIAIDAENTIADALYIECDTITTGSIAEFYSNSADTSSRSLLEIINDNQLATGAIGLSVQQDAAQSAAVMTQNADANVLNIQCTGVSTQNGFLVSSSNNLTTGRLAEFYSDAANSSTRSLVRMINDNPLATGATVLELVQDAAQNALLVKQNASGYGILVQQNANNRAIEIECTGITESFGLSVSTANNLTTGGLARFYSNADNAVSRNLIQIVNDNPIATGSVCMNIKQDANQTALQITSAGISIDASGGQIFSTTIVTSATHTVDNSDAYILVNYTQTGTVTITIPSTEVENGRLITIKDVGGNAGTNNITINTGGAETIDGNSSFVLNNNYQSVTLISDGTGWYIV